MPASPACDAVVVGSGPNGLVAAVLLALDGLSVRLYEAASSLGGGTRTAELTLPGFRHDVCSAVHPLGVGSPVLSALPLDELGLTWVHPAAPLAHPFDDRPAAVLRRSVDETAEGLGGDGPAYRRLMGPLAPRWDDVAAGVLGPLRLPRHPLTLARFGLRAMRSIDGLVRGLFDGPEARAMLAGVAAHSALRLDRPPSAAFGMMLALAGHAVGWPVALGGSQSISDALGELFRRLGGEIITDTRVASLDELPPSRLVLLDITPRQLLRMAGDRLPWAYRKRLEAYRYGPGVFKIDWALDGPVPWKDPSCSLAATVHLGGTLDELRASEAEVNRGRLSDRPFVLLAQPTLFDPTRAPPGRHIAWGYCHVPHGFEGDATALIEQQIERFAPGFRDRVLARATRGPREMERYDENYVGGDINGGVPDLFQLFTRPVVRRVPYETPLEGVYLCSSSTPPGGGVHGMCGYWAARYALARLHRQALAAPPRRPVLASARPAPLAAGGGAQLAQRG